MISDIRFKSQQNMNFATPQLGVVNPNQTNNNDNTNNTQPQAGNPAAMSLNPSDVSQFAQKTGVAVGNGIHSALATGIAVVAGGFALFKASKAFSASKHVFHSSFLDNSIPVTNTNDLKKYIADVAKTSGEYLKTAKKKIKITFNVEKYAKDKVGKNFLDLTSSDLKNLKKDDTRLKDIADSINGIIEIGRRTGNNSGLKMTMYNVKPGEQDSFLKYLKENEGFINLKSKGVPDVLSNVLQVENTKQFKGIKFVNSNDYIAKNNDGIWDSMGNAWSATKDILGL